MKIITFWVFTYLLKRDNYIKFTNIENWPRLVLNEIETFQFQVILEHAAFNAKGDNVIFHSLLKLFHMFLIRLLNEDGFN